MVVGWGIFCFFGIVLDVLWIIMGMIGICVCMVIWNVFFLKVFNCFFGLWVFLGVSVMDRLFFWIVLIMGFIVLIVFFELFWLINIILVNWNVGLIIGKFVIFFLLIFVKFLFNSLVIIKILSEFWWLKMKIVGWWDYKCFLFFMLSFSFVKVDVKFVYKLRFVFRVLCLWFVKV